MARGANITVENQFTKGLITEFTAMNFPENAVTEGDNCVFSELGKVTPRLGLDYEADAEVHLLTDLSPTPSTQNKEAYVEYEWFSVGNNGSTKFLVQQIGQKIVFFRSGEGSISPNLEPFSINLNTYRVPPNTTVQVRETPCQFTTGNGNLFIANPYIDPLFVEYNSGTNTISIATIDLKIRDTQGVDDGFEVGERPEPTLTNLHHYNILNQGWYHDLGSETVLDVWESVYGSDGPWPSNADIWWLFKEATGEFDPSRAQEFALGNTPAPKGHYIYSAFDVDRTEMTGVSGLPSETSGSARPSCIVWYAGRVWYAGVRRDKYSSTLYFSQLIERDTQYGDCYQANDPTSETVFDLLDTDGGTILLPLIEEVVALKVIGDALIVVGSNAIYSVTGADNGAFKATDYVVKYVSPVGAVSHLSLVEAEGALVWINYEGIYSMNQDQAGFSFVVNNISKQTIQSILDDIPVDNRNYIKGAYNKREQVLRWVYSDESSLTYFRYNRILDLNLVSKAFYTHTISTSLSPRVCGLISLHGEVERLTIEEVVTNDGDEVLNSILDPVEVMTHILVPSQEIFKFSVTGGIHQGDRGFTYGELRDTTYVDWRSTDGVGDAYTAYGISGYRIRGEMLRSFNASPTAFVIRNVENGSLNISGIWDYGERQSLPQELYSYSETATHLVKKVRIRGKGKSLQIKFEGTPGQPFELVGWSTFDTGGTQP